MLQHSVALHAEVTLFGGEAHWLLFCCISKVLGYRGGECERECVSESFAYVTERQGDWRGGAVSLYAETLWHASTKSLVFDSFHASLLFIYMV